MQKIVVITDAWGPKYGGINSFNTDFCKALGHLLGPGRVICVVLTAVAAEKKDAKLSNVKLRALGIGAFLLESEVVNELAELKGAVAWWVGHDAVSGHIANRLKLEYGGKSAVFQHMSYGLYSNWKKKNGDAVQDQTERQRIIAKACDRLFGVGPLLYDEAKSLRNKVEGVFELVPGLADIAPRKVKSTQKFSAIIFGRMTEDDDVIKQGMAAVKAFGRAVKELNLYDGGKTTTLMVVGLSKDDKEYDYEHGLIMAAVEKEADRKVHVVPIRYRDDRETVFDLLSRHHVCLMPSLHEGFGLVAWEAIAAEVPLILSMHSGCYQLLNEKHPELCGLFEAADIKGTDADVETLKNCLCRIKSNTNWQKNAAKLKKNLLKKYTWEKAARCFAKACEIVIRESETDSDQKPDGPEDVAVVVEKGVARALDSTGVGVTLLRQKIADQFRDGGRWTNPTAAAVAHKLVALKLLKGMNILTLALKYCIDDVTGTHDTEKKIIWDSAEAAMGWLLLRAVNEKFLISVMQNKEGTDQGLIFRFSVETPIGFEIVISRYYLARGEFCVTKSGVAGLHGIPCNGELFPLKDWSTESNFWAVVEHLWKALVLYDVFPGIKTEETKEKAIDVLKNTLKVRYENREKHHLLVDVSGVGLENAILIRLHQELGLRLAIIGDASGGQVFLEDGLERELRLRLNHFYEHQIK